ncbi:MAG: Gfo/Idh/MocA family oxidoreductase [Lentisphaeria bacterium]|jgi:predicted dehydrogenase
MTALRVAIIGCGGFAAEHHRAIKALEAEGLCRLVATCDPAAAARDAAAATHALAARGVRLFPDYLEMLDRCAGELDAVTIATPIQCHGDMHRECARRGLPMYLEKPPTLDLAELQAMIAADATLTRQTQVGFNFIGQSARQQLKQRLLAGEFGALRGVAFYGVWPRGLAYFHRSPWAGRRRLDGKVVLDSCFTNAMAHFVHNLLFWCGTDGLFSWRRPDLRRCRMARAYPVETADTVFLEGTLPGNGEFRIAMTHACAGDHEDLEMVRCERATIRYHEHQPGLPGRRFRVAWNDGRTEELDAAADIVPANFRRWLAYLRGEEPRPMTRLADCLPFVELSNLAFAAAEPVRTLAAAEYQEKPLPNSLDTVREIPGIRDACRAFAETGEWPTLWP